MTISNDRLKILRDERGIKQKELAQLLSITERTYRHYEAGEIDPPTSKTALLANFFDVSVDYLLGRTDDRDTTLVNDDEFFKGLPIRKVHDMKIEVTDEEEIELKAHLEYLRWKEQMKKKGHNL